MQKIISSKLLVTQLRTKLMNHEIYQFIDNQSKINLFMERHVWAVWDFMILLKQLQRRLTCTNKIWIPVKNTSAARFINQIVVGEQTDSLQSSQDYISHAQLYIKAMAQIGADSSEIQKAWSKIRQGASFDAAIKQADIPNYVKDFVKNTVRAIDQPTSYVTAQFFYGREDPIPQMFQKFVNKLDNKNNNSLTMMMYYLKRHIQVDGEQHGPIAQKMLSQIAKTQDNAQETINLGAINALQNRIKLWDGIMQELKV